MMKRWIICTSVATYCMLIMKKNENFGQSSTKCTAICTSGTNPEEHLCGSKIESFYSYYEINSNEEKIVIEDLEIIC